MHVVITGASSGIGRALAAEYGRAGAALTLVARREALLLDVQREVGRPCHIVVRDLSRLETVADWIPDAEAKNGPVDVFINNAGIMDIGPTAELPVEIGQRMLDVCLSAPLRLTRAIMPAMLARKAGTIVQVASVAALVPPPGGTWYGAAKAGLAAFSETLRSELAGTGVRVLTVYPGPVATPLAEGARATYAESLVIDSMPEGTPEVLATRIRRSVEKGAARLFYPRAYGLTRWFPNVTQWLTLRVQPGYRDTALLPATAPTKTLPQSPVNALLPSATKAAAESSARSPAQSPMVAP